MYGRHLANTTIYIIIIIIIIIIWATFIACCLVQKQKIETNQVKQKIYIIIIIWATFIACCLVQKQKIETNQVKQKRKVNGKCLHLKVKSKVSWKWDWKAEKWDVTNQKEGI